MTPTELMLLAIYRGPVPLDDICTRYLNMNREVAYKAAALNHLPFPTFRLSESKKAPLLVDLRDLAAHIDHSRECAKASWEHSQV
jgi:hypothetical protein